MTSGKPVQPSEDHSIPDDLKVTIENNFGRFDFQVNKAVALPQGLIGIPELEIVGFTDFGDEENQFKLMQSLQEPLLSFITLPLSAESGLIDADDLRQAADAAEIDYANAGFVAIVTVRQVFEQTKITANLRAPIVIDTAEQVARQVVLTNNKYDVQFSLQPSE